MTGFPGKTISDAWTWIEDGAGSHNMELLMNDAAVPGGGYEVLQPHGLFNFNHRDRLEKSKKAPKIEEEQIIGFDRAVEDLSQLLAKGSEQFQVISIVGKIGNEKTTLAKKVLKHPDVDYEFMIRAFVHVSKEYETRQVFLKILSSFGKIKDDVKKMPEDQLRKHLHQQLQGKRYLVILDDVLKEDDWDRFKSAFPHNDKRCRVLITTCNEDVVKNLNPEIPFYRLDFLRLDQSSELFRRKVFGNENFPEEFQPYELQIMENCNGLPLAIVVIAGVIHHDRYNGEHWKLVADSIKDCDARDHNQLTKMIELVYSYLPDPLKPCFTYLGVFRGDFEIPVWKLIRLWIAEGLIIQPAGDPNSEGIAEWYLEELVCRNLVMVGKRRSCGKMKTCRVHDTLLEFCKKKGMQENKEITKDNEVVLDHQYTRLYINNVNVRDYISKRPSSNGRVLSFLTFPKEDGTIVEPKFVNSIPKAYKFLKVLEVESLIFTRFPIDLSYLSHLEYIAISSTFTTLPPVMSTMKDLKTLIVNTSSPTLAINANIWKMPHFRHLHTNSCATLPPPEAGNNKTEQTIQTLSTISPESCRKEVFDQAPKLKKLGIFGELNRLFGVKGESSVFKNLGRLECLENLKLLNDDMNSISCVLPPEESFPKNLKSLTLENTLLEWREMSTLGKLECLQVLKLKIYAFQGKFWKTEGGGFLSLNHLQIGHTDLVVWETWADHFPELRCLHVAHCNELEALPQDLANISSLKSVVLHCNNPTVAASGAKLQMLKLQEQSQNGSFKLFIYPPDHRPHGV
ncbi:OLC1v1033359C1 [Oldenlandia corymbosa var. corymbosa]|uniref:OLC1v1033359C1 n=1 Tax=Oldenlandia corymbosa var. corymbosa TaxID=529605 RepID=A0AAV1CN87_OLDCO|nr:OLC1v1033359C1 [Oldenlandia corymbosa var. corymbosa]